MQHEWIGANTLKYILRALLRMGMHAMRRNRGPAYARKQTDSRSLLSSNTHLNTNRNPRGKHVGLQWFLEHFILSYLNPEGVEYFFRLLSRVAVCLQSAIISIIPSECAVYSVTRWKVARLVLRRVSLLSRWEFDLLGRRKGEAFQKEMKPCFDCCYCNKHKLTNRAGGRLRGSGSRINTCSIYIPSYFLVCRAAAPQSLQITRFGSEICVLKDLHAHVTATSFAVDEASYMHWDPSGKRHRRVNRWSHEGHVLQHSVCPAWSQGNDCRQTFKTVHRHIIELDLNPPRSRLPKVLPPRCLALTH